MLIDSENDPHACALYYYTEPGDHIGFHFNGNKLWHAVTPLATGEERVVLTMEYVTNQEMALPKRIFSNLKDAFAYFGVSALWPRWPR